MYIRSKSHTPQRGLLDGRRARSRRLIFLLFVLVALTRMVHSLPQPVTHNRQSHRHLHRRAERLGTPLGSTVTPSSTSANFIGSSTQTESVFSVKPGPTTPPVFTLNDLQNSTPAVTTPSIGTTGNAATPTLPQISQLNPTNSNLTRSSDFSNITSLSLDLSTQATTPTLSVSETSVGTDPSSSSPTVTSGEGLLKNLATEVTTPSAPLSTSTAFTSTPPVATSSVALSPSGSSSSETTISSPAVFPDVDLQKDLSVEVTTTPSGQVSRTSIPPLTLDLQTSIAPTTPVTTNPAVISIPETGSEVSENSENTPNIPLAVPLGVQLQKDPETEAPTTVRIQVTTSSTTSLPEATSPISTPPFNAPVQPIGLPPVVSTTNSVAADVPSFEDLPKVTNTSSEQDGLLLPESSTTVQPGVSLSFDTTGNPSVPTGDTMLATPTVTDGKIAVPMTVSNIDDTLNTPETSFGLPVGVPGPTPLNSIPSPLVLDSSTSVNVSSTVPISNPIAPDLVGLRVDTTSSLPTAKSASSSVASPSSASNPITTSSSTSPPSQQEPPDPPLSEISDTTYVLNPQMTKAAASLPASEKGLSINDNIVALADTLTPPTLIALYVGVTFFALLLGIAVWYAVRRFRKKRKSGRKQNFKRDSDTATGSQQTAIVGGKSEFFLEEGNGTQDTVFGAIRRWMRHPWNSSSAATVASSSSLKASSAGRPVSYNRPSSKDVEALFKLEEGYSFHSSSTSRLTRLMRWSKSSSRVSVAPEKPLKPYPRGESGSVTTIPEEILIVKETGDADWRLGGLKLDRGSYRGPNDDSQSYQVW